MAQAPVPSGKSDPARANSLAIFGEAALVDQDGSGVTEERLKGKLIILNFIFTRCGTSCPVQTEELAALQKIVPARLAPHVLFVSVSVDPEHDHPSDLKQYAEERHLDLRYWTLVTGSAEQVGRLTHNFDVFAANSSKPGSGFHTTDIRLFNGSGQMVQRYNGVPVDKTRLLRELEALAAMF